MTQLAGRLVRGLGLGAAATAFDSIVRDAGLKPPSRFGKEVAARLLAHNHPAASDGLELLPRDEGDARGGRVLGGQDPRLRRFGGRRRAGRGGDVRAAVLKPGSSECSRRPFASSATRPASGADEGDG